MPIEGPLLDVKLSVDYPNKPNALRDVSFSLQPGETLGLVGESGSGKSTIALALLGLLGCKGGRASGHIVFAGQDLLTRGEKDLRRLRGSQIGLVLQSPLASLNPVLRVGTQLAEAWRAHAHGSHDALDEAVRHALMRVGLPVEEEFRRRLPSQVSVGQAQRVLIAMAIMHSPRLLIADEPTSALDAVTQVEILSLLANLNQQFGAAMLYISHDLQSVVSLCQRVAILQAGSIVEQGPTGAVLSAPRHPYTRLLVSCAPWLPAWMEQLGAGKRCRGPQPDSAALPGHAPASPVPEYRGLKSPCQWPMG
ncbi:MAG TPA: ABC transporter ATP-binding protein [Candidatus Angelobacter sp.]|nr:ABC transporter ATP-binding protein [Candidatus Angelobacter sp.]